MTYNNIIDVFKDIAANDPFIKRFGSGEITEGALEASNSGLYPLLWVVPQSALMTENTLDYTFRVLVFEQDDTDDSKQQLILSNDLQIIIDIIKRFKYELDDDVSISGSQTLVPFSHRFVDYCTGWYSDMTITTPLDNSPCSIA